MSQEEMQIKFKEILLYGYQRGNEEGTLSASDLVQELADKMKDVLWVANTQG